IGQVIAALKRQQGVACKVGGFDASTGCECMILAHHAYCTCLVEHLCLEFAARKMETGRGQSHVVKPVQQSLLKLWRGDGMKADIDAFVLTPELRDNPRQHAHPEHRRCSDAENARSRSPDQRNRLLDFL